MFIRTFFVRGKIGGDGSEAGKIRVGEFVMEGTNSDSERDAPGTFCGGTPQPLCGKCVGDALKLIASSGANGGHALLGSSEVEVAGGADGGLWEVFALGEAVVDFVADDGAEIGVGCFLVFAVADTAVEEVGAVADVALVFV